MGGQVEQLPTQVLADQLTLSQSEGADYAHQLLLDPSDFLPSATPEFELVLYCYGRKIHYSISGNLFRWRRLLFLPS